MPWPLQPRYIWSYYTSLKNFLLFSQSFALSPWSPPFPDSYTIKLMQHVDVHVYILKWHNIFEIHIHWIANISFLPSILAVERLHCNVSPQSMEKLQRAKRSSKAAIPFCIIPTVHGITSSPCPWRCLFLSLKTFGSIVHMSQPSLFSEEKQHHFDSPIFCGLVLLWKI